MKLARLYDVSLDYIFGFTDRSCIFIDSMSPKNQEIIKVTIETLKKALGTE